MRPALIVAHAPAARDHLHARARPGHHVQGAGVVVEGQGVRLLHGSITHLLDGYSGGQIVTNDAVRRSLRHPGQPRRAGQPVRRARAPGTAAAASAGRCRTPAAPRRGCRRPARGPPGRRPSWWRPRRPAARARPWCPTASTVVTEVWPRSSTTTVLPCATSASTRAKICSRAPTAVSEPSVYTAPSALPSTSLPSARRAIAVKSVSRCAVDVDRVHDRAVGDVDREVAAPWSTGTPCRRRRRRSRSPARAAARCAAPPDGRNAVSDGPPARLAAEHHQRRRAPRRTPRPHRPAGERAHRPRGGSVTGGDTAAAAGAIVGGGASPVFDAARRRGQPASRATQRRCEPGDSSVFRCGGKG